MTRLCTPENPQSVRTLAGLFVLTGVLSMPNQRPALALEKTTSATIGAIQLHNASTLSAAPPLPPLPEHELESPNFVPPQLTRFAAAGYVRRNRWA